MPLDPQVEELLRELAELGYPALEDCSPPEARRNLASRIDSFSELEDIFLTRDGIAPSEELQDGIPYREYRPNDNHVLPALV